MSVGFLVLDSSSLIKQIADLAPYTTNMRLRFLIVLVAGFFATHAHSQNYDLQHVQFWLSFDEAERTIQMRVINRVLLLVDAPKALRFDAKDITFKSTKVNGVTARVEISPESCLVFPDSKFKKNDVIEVEFVYTAQPTGGLYFVNQRDAWPAKSSMVYTKGQPEYNKNWLVTYGFPDDKTTSECWITCGQGKVAVSNGVLADVNKGVYHWIMDQPHPTYLIAFIVGDFEKKTEKYGDKPVEYYYPRGLESQATASFAGTNRMIETFSKLLGVEYPFDRFSQMVAGDYVTGGMENTTMVINNISTLHEPFEKPLADSTGLVAHELAHQWFGDFVTCKDWSHLWINEGFASFLPAFWTRSSEGEDEYDLDRKAIMGGGLSQSNSDKSPVVSSDFGGNIERVYRNAVYGGSAARLFMLMDLLGEKSFWSGVRQFLIDYKYSPATTDDFFNSISKSAGKDLHWFKNQWFMQAGAHQVNVSYFDGKLTVTKNSENDLDLPIWSFTGGGWTHGVLKMRGGIHSASYEVDAPLIVDPERRLLMNLTGAPTFPAELAVKGWIAAKSASLKDELLKYLPQDGTIIAELIAQESSPTLRSRLVARLGKDDVPILIGLLTNPDRRVANTALGRLGVCEPTPTVLQAIQDVMENDTNPRIRCNALEQLVKFTKDSSLIERAWQTEAPNDCFKIFALREWSRIEPNRARSLSLALVRSSNNINLRVTAIGLLGSLKDTPESRDVYNALIAIVRDEHNYRPRLSAASALATYGDKAALVFLKPLSAEAHTRFTNAIDSAIRRLERAT